MIPPPSPSLPLPAISQHLAHAVTFTILRHCSSCFSCPVSVGNMDFPNLLLVKTLLISIFVCAFGKPGTPDR